MRLFAKPVFKKTLLAKIPQFILFVDPGCSVSPEEIIFLQTAFPETNIKKLSPTYDGDGIHFLDKRCRRKCSCTQPDLILLIDNVFRFNVGCFMLLGKAEILFSRRYSRKFFHDSLLHFSSCEIRNGL
eukprot:jgi/Antlo1/2048/634